MDHTARIDELEARLRHEVVTRERLEKELQENQSRYQALVRALPDAMFSLNGEGVYLDYIPAKGFETVSAPEEFLGKSIHEIMPSDIAEASMHFIKEALRTKEKQRFEYDLSMGGKMLHFEALIVPDENEADSVWALVRDITTHKQAEEKLSTTEQYLDTILLNLPVGVAILEGPDFRYYRINHQLAEMNGLSVEAHLGRPLAEVLPEAAPDIIPGLRHVLETGEARLNREFSTRLPKDPGVIRHFTDSFFPIYGADGKPRAVGAVVLDITESKRAELALQKSEELYRTLFETANDAILTVRPPEGYIIDANTATLEMLGYTLTELRALKGEDIIAPEVLAKTEQDWATQVEKKGHFLTETRWVRKDGSQVPVDASGGLVEIQGEFFIQLITRDITERKQAEAALQSAYAELEQRVKERTTELTQSNAALQQEIGERKQAEKQFRQVHTELEHLFTTIPIGMCLLDNDLRYMHINKLLADFNGRPAAEHIGRTLQEMIPDVAPFVAPLFRQVLETGTPYRGIELRSGTQSEPNRERDWLIDLYDFRSARGVMLGVLVILQDITERKRAEEALRESEERLRAFVEALPGLALILDEEGRYVEVFTTQEQLLYAEAAQLKGKLLHEVLPDAAARLFLSTVRQAIESGATQTLEYELEVLGGPRWFEGHVAPMPGPVGQRRMVVWISHDITERKWAKETLRLQREELAHVQRTTMMGELTAALAHEINQPLTAIRSNAQAALRFMNTETPDLDEIREILDDIVADDRRAAEVIIRLRALLQKKTVSTAPLDLNAVVGEVTGLLHSDAVIKNVAVELDLAEGLPPVLGDRVQLQQVLLNLIINGFDAMEDVPTPERILVIRTAQEAGSLVHVSVRDAGEGFAGQDVEGLFTAFHTTKAEGMGMGLAISRSIIEAHGGKIWAEDNADRGATFYFTLPVEASV